MSPSENGTSVVSCIAALEQRIEAACLLADRKRSEVALVAVSKKKPATMIREAYRIGLRDFGENYAQELRDKASQLTDLAELRWHFIGPLQRNKAQHVVGQAAVIHSVDSLPLLERVDRLAQGRGVVQDLLFQLNISGEASKSGAPPDALPELVQAASSLSHVRCVGLMTMPPLGASPRIAAPLFRRLRQLRDGLLADACATCVHLSIGMSGDFEAAIEHGATVVRIGSLIFGERHS